mmetsp:Transcript_18620/g.18866  ORF Transcript_18620/g.18866 Transcript_18620/m.18866 type:complete len:87 (+) Transcript_18620:279-539(+)
MIDTVNSFNKKAIKYGAKLEFNYAISREDRPESSLGQGHISMDTIKQAFNVTKKPYGQQDPNVKWLIVGSFSLQTKIVSHADRVRL